MKVIPIIGNDNSFLYRFLVSSRFRVARHITVIVALLVIACNLVLFSCQGYIEMLGKWTYLLIFNMFLLYGSIFYFNLLYLVPRYLLKQRYLTYILSLSTALIVVFIFQATQEYIVSDIFSVPNIYVGYHFMPDPDLLIRTGGEIRLSNYLLWQCAYSELYFCETYWPDFREEELCKAICDYQRRERRFGKTSEQIS